MPIFYRCPNCGFIHTEPDYCPACLSESQKVFGDFESIEEAMACEYYKRR
jgi:rubrerythrin